jgi:ubiquinone/menaquinone biosynthesis C-methylase UbiE
LTRDSEFRVYSEKQVHFYVQDVPQLLESALALLSKSAWLSILDLGCGDGALIFALHERGLLEDAGEIVGVDISEDRIRRLTANLPFVKGVVADALELDQFADSSFDLVICSQLIEHVKDDEFLVSEIRRLLKHGGLLYVSSVIKRPWAVYVYFKEGSFKLDPTHVREYSSVQEFVSLFAEEGLETVKVETRQVTFPVLDLVIRLLIRTGLLEPQVEYFQAHKNLSKLRELRLPIIGYQIVQSLTKKE